MRLPRLLDASMHEVCRLNPEALSLQLSMTPLSTATMTLPQGEPDVPVGSYVELYTPTGSAGVFRVQQAEQTFATTTRLMLEHGLVTLADSLIPASGENVVSTAPHAIASVLSHQDVWKLGVCDVPEDLLVTWSYDYSNLLQSLLDLMDKLPQYMLTFDQSATPWVVNVVALTDENASECRLSRNLRSVSMETDWSELCTRLYIPMDGAETVVLNADTQSAYGIVSRSYSGDSGLTGEELTKSGLQYLQQHQHPKIVVTLDAFDLSEATGEALDKFHLGRMCCVCLPTYGTTIDQRVVQIAYPDVYGEPDHVQVTLADKSETTADVLAGLVVETTVIRKRVVVTESKLGSDAEWYTQRVATGVISKELTRRLIPVQKSDGTTENVSVITDIDLTPATVEISYIGRPSKEES